VCVGLNLDPYKNGMGYGLLLPVFRGLSVYVLVIAVIPTKTAELTEVMFEMWTQMDQGTVSYVGAQIPQGEWAILGTSPAHCEV